jgi:hypothetical protein
MQLQQHYSHLAAVLDIRDGLQGMYIGGVGGGGGGGGVGGVCGLMRPPGAFPPHGNAAPVGGTATTAAAAAAAGGAAGMDARMLRSGLGKTIARRAADDAASARELTRCVQSRSAHC